MKSIKSLVEYLNKVKDRQREFNAFSILDNNILELQNHIRALELRNLKYYCSVTRNANQIITPPGAFVIFNVTDYPQFGNMHTNVANVNDNIYIRRNGVYHIFAGVKWEGGAGPTARTTFITLIRNGGAINIAENTTPNIGVNFTHLLGRSYYLYDGDIIKLSVALDGAVTFDLMLQNGMPFLTVAERMEDLDPSQYGLLNPEENTR